MAVDVVSTIWFWITFFVYLGILAVIGWFSHKKTKNITDFLVASRGIGSVLLALSFGATYFSAVLLIGCPGYTWINGLQWMTVTILNTFFGTVVAFILLGNRTRRLSKKLGSLTLPEMIAQRYQDDKYIKPTAGIVIAVFLSIYLGSIFYGLSTVLQVLFPGFVLDGINWAYIIAVFICGAVTAFYLIVGGSHSAILSDLFESLVMVAGVVGIIIGGVIMAELNGGMFNNIVADITATASSPFNSNPALWFVFPNVVSMSMIGMALVTTFGVWGSPQMTTRFFTAKDRRSVRYGVIVACIWVFVVSFCAWFSGAVGRGLTPTSTVDMTNFINSIGGNMKKFPEYVIPWMLVGVGILPLPFTALFLAAVTAASLTTGEKLILVAAGSVVRDFYQKGVAKSKNLSDESALKWTKIVIIPIVGVSLFIAIAQPAFILDLCMFSWACLNAFTLVPYVAGLFWKGGTKRAAFWSGIIALAVALAWFFCFYSKWSVPGLPLFPQIGNLTIIATPWFNITPASIHEFIVSQAVAIPAFFLISHFDKNKPDPKFLEETFAYMKEDTNE